MKRLPTILLLLTFLICGSSEAAYIFKSSSQLKSGNWVKIFTEGSGIYEISYSKLKEMGFSDPSRVGVYGKGAAPMSLNFCDISGRQVCTDDLEPVAVLHTGDRLLFYARGPMDFSYNNVQFDRSSTNLYSIRGAYFLTDKDETPLQMKTCEAAPGSKVEYKSGTDFIHHERDIFHNTTSTGQLYWGESLIDSTRYGWPIDIPYVDLSRPGRMVCKVYAAPASSGTISFGVVNAEGNRSYRIVPPSISEFRTQSVTAASPSLRGDRAVVFVECENPVGSFINLDYWTFTYPKRIPDFTLPHSAPQERLFVTPTSTAQGYIPMTTNRDITVFDVSDPAAPYILRNERSGDILNALFNPSTTYNSLVLCNMGEPQYSISGYEPVRNSDIHSLAQEGADMLIITVERYHDHALRLAELHESLNNTKVRVLTLADVYNEFSGGIPDPMAIRAAAKLFHDTGATRLRNLLLFGPVYGDVRAMEIAGQHEENIIGFQGTSVAVDSEAPNVMDFYGFLDDYINTYSLYDNKMQIGVGLLPLYSEADAERAIRKTEKYLTDAGRAMMVNEFFSIGGTGNSHTHEYQAVELIDSILYKTHNFTPCVTPVLAIDAYGEKRARNKFIGNINRGTLFTWYHGHASFYLLNNTKEFFTNADLTHLNNNHLGFLFIGGCDLSGTDWKRRGLGENFVTGTDHGFVGVIMSSRTSWSGQNFKLAKCLIQSLLYERESSMTRRKASPTIGEIYADTKTRSKESNDLNYILIGDPALKVPVPIARFATQPLSSMKPGESLTLSGTVTDLNGKLLKDYDGKVYAKLMAPPMTMVSSDYETGTVHDQPAYALKVTYRDNILATFEGSVSNGSYTLRFSLPADVAAYAGEELPLYLSAYDSSAEIAAADRVMVPVSLSGDGTSADSTPPRIEASYDPEGLCMKAVISDDQALAPNALRAYVDGRERGSVIDLTGDAVASVRELTIPLHDLKAGRHAGRLSAVDISGNRSEIDIDFTVSPMTPALKLSLAEAAVRDSAEFSFEGNVSGNTDLMVLDSEGRIVFRTSLTDRSFKWDCRDNEGNALPTGLYKARVAAASSGEAHLCSAWTYFAIL